jgi:pimeloyl-ACP methyl ester carboxylesterase
MSSIDVNGTRLYHEERGRGPAVLFISGATGDAGHWTEAADILAVAYTVITYDRRANSRSPRPAGWASTTVGEQAADAAALLRGLDLVPAIVFGTQRRCGHPRRPVPSPPARATRCYLPRAGVPVGRV